MTTHDHGARRVPTDLAARLALAAGLAVLTWLVALVAAGVVAGIDPGNPLGVVSLLVVVVLAAPLYRVAPWRPEPGRRVLAWVRTNRTAIGVAGGLFLVRALPFAPGPLVGLLDLPFRVTGLLFGVELFYRTQVGPEVGAVLRRFAQWYIEALWLLVIGGLAVDLGRWIR